MPPHQVTAHNGIISLDPSNPIHDEIKPLIADILRTKYCIQGSVFLVEAIDAVAVGRGQKGMRLLLGDGELVIQGFVRGRMHWVVEQGKVFEGGYVRLDKFGLEEVVTEVEMEKGKAQQKECFLVVGDLRTVGWDEEYLEVLREGGREVKDVRELMMGGEKKEGGRLFGLEARVREMEVRKRREMEMEKEKKREDDERRRRKQEAEMVEQEEEATVEEQEEEATVEEQKDEAKVGERNEDYISESDYEDDVFDRMEILTDGATQRRAMATAATSTNNITIPQRPPPFRQQPQQPEVLPQPPPPRQILTPKTPQPQSITKPQSNTTPKPLPWLSDNPFQPLKLTPLSQIPYLPYKQNWMVNVLVIVTQLGEVEPCPYPPYEQRQARVIDQSTPDKHIHLTVFLEPDEFEPRLGDVFLLMGVKNHKFDGGSLKKYVSDRPKGGGRWWVEGSELGWCRGVVEELQSWWERQKGDGVGSE